MKSSYSYNILFFSYYSHLFLPLLIIWHSTFILCILRGVLCLHLPWLFFPVNIEFLFVINMHNKYDEFNNFYNFYRDIYLMKCWWIIAKISRVKIKDNIVIVKTEMSILIIIIFRKFSFLILITIKLNYIWQFYEDFL